MLIDLISIETLSDSFDDYTTTTYSYNTETSEIYLNTKYKNAHRSPYLDESHGYYLGKLETIKFIEKYKSKLNTKHQHLLTAIEREYQLDKIL